MKSTRTVKLYFRIKAIKLQYQFKRSQLMKSQPHERFDIKSFQALPQR